MTGARATVPALERTMPKSTTPSKTPAKPKTPSKPAAKKPPARKFSDTEKAIGSLLFDRDFRDAFCDCGGDVKLLGAFAKKNGLKLTAAELQAASKITEQQIEEALAALLGQGAPTGTV
jgi:hypothetical protein